MDSNETELQSSPNSYFKIALQIAHADMKSSEAKLHLPNQNITQSCKINHECKSLLLYIFLNCILNCEKLDLVQKARPQKQWIVVTTGLLLHAELSAIK